MQLEGGAAPRATLPGTPGQMRVMVDSGALGRYVGENAPQPGPARLADIVVPVLDISPFVMGANMDAAPRPILVELAPSAALQTLSPANPAAGAPFTVTVPTGEHWFVRSISWVYTSSGVAANRYQLVEASLGGVVLWRTGHPTAQNPGVAVNWTAQLGVGQWRTNLDGGFPLGSTFVPQGWQLLAYSREIQGGDAITNVRIIYERHTAL